MTLAEKRLARAEKMATKYRIGATLREIGDYYGITRERVRQIMTGELGITWKDGGVHHRMKARREAAKARKDQQYIRKYGMTFAQYKKINPDSSDYYGSPIGKHRRQLQNARNRDIEWNLTFAEWWEIWQQSGKWQERGRGRGYVMSRYEDKGAYVVGNVRIIPGPENNSEYIRRYWKQVYSGERPYPKGTTRPD